MSTRHSEKMRLPWLGTLVAFESAARLGSLKLAAAELSLTPGAVSRQVKSLEQSLGARLFVRSHNAIEMTSNGRVFLAHVEGALAELRKGAREVSGRPAKLTIRAPITLTQRWLIPRLDDFRNEHPGIDLRFRTVNAPTSDGFDIEISYMRGLPKADDANGGIFLVDYTMPICKADILKSRKGRTRPEDILSFPVIQDTIDGWSWRRWCENAGIPFEPKAGTLVFDTDEAAIDACLSGLGVAQGSMAFVTDVLRSRAATLPCPSTATILGAYFAITHIPSRKADAFVAWLKAQGNQSSLDTL